MSGQSAARPQLRSAASEFLSLRRKSDLLSEAIDPLASGALSLILFGLAFALLDKAGPTHSIGWAAYYLGFVVNWPHFAASYMILYRTSIRQAREPRVLWAAFLCPAVLIGCLAVIWRQASSEMMAWMIQAMFFFVGWHYVKQVLGITLVFCHLENYRLSTSYKRLLHINLIMLWLMNWIVLNATTDQHQFFGFKYAQMGLPAWSKTTALFAFAVSCLAVLWAGVRHYLKTGAVPPRSAVIAWLSIGAWYVPALHHPAFFIFIPFFHSLQYLLFVASYRSSKVQAANREMKGEAYRRRVLRDHSMFFGSALALGYLFFELLPSTLDKAFAGAPFTQGQFFMAAFTLFINIHHYFIDNVIWKQGFGDTQLYLSHEHMPEATA